jgi:hypothetical protein
MMSASGTRKPVVRDTPEKARALRAEVVEAMAVEAMVLVIWTFLHLVWYLGWDSFPNPVTTVYTLWQFWSTLFFVKTRFFDFDLPFNKGVGG